jgi:ElaB/YqjD/DUF883 family membrane-anchored ribosome-binding protein
MASETEVIKHQMDDTRASLTEKLETLELQVGDTVQGATQAVENVKEAVQNTVEIVKESVQETVQTVKDTFDLPSHVRRHPWAMVGGAMAVGALGGFLLSRATAPRRRRPEHEFPLGQQSQAWQAVSQVERHTNGHAGNGKAHSRRSVREEPAQPGFFSGLSEAVAPEITKLKSLFIGSMLGVVRDIIAKAAPEPVAEPLTEVLNNVTVRLGGRPLEGSVFARTDTQV